MSGAQRKVWPQEPEVRFRKAGTSVPVAPVVRDRQDEARMLRKRGWTWDGIARRYGITAIEAQVLVLGRTAADADGVSEQKIFGGASGADRHPRGAPERAREPSLARSDREGTRGRGNVFQWTPARLALLDIMARDGLTARRIAERFDCDVALVGHTLRERGWAWNGSVWKRTLGGGERTEAAE